MKSFRQLSEEKGEKAHREAIAMGLKYKGFGYWADPQTGQTKYKTQNDQLVPVDPEQESELYKGGKDGDMESPDGQGRPGMAGPGGRSEHWNGWWCSRRETTRGRWMGSWS